MTNTKVTTEQERLETSATSDIFSHLQQTLTAALEERKTIEQKYAEDKQRIEVRIAELRDSIGSWANGLQNLVKSADDVLSPQPKVTSAKTLAQQAEELEVRDIRNATIQQQQKQSEQTPLWQYLILFIVAVIALIIFLSVTEQKNEEAPPAAMALPSFIGTAHADPLPDIRSRLQESICERRERRLGSLSEDPLPEEEFFDEGDLLLEVAAEERVEEMEAVVEEIIPEEVTAEEAVATKETGLEGEIVAQLHDAVALIVDKANAKQKSEHDAKAIQEQIAYEKDKKRKKAVEKNNAQSTIGDLDDTDTPPEKLTKKVSRDVPEMDEDDDDWNEEDDGEIDVSADAGNEFWDETGGLR